MKKGCCVVEENGENGEERLLLVEENGENGEEMAWSNVEEMVLMKNGVDALEMI